MWISGRSPTSSVHSLEILIPDTTYYAVCVDQLEDAQSQVWTKETWVEDTSLTIRCIDPDFNSTDVNGKLRSFFRK